MNFGCIQAKVLQNTVSQSDFPKRLETNCANNVPKSERHMKWQYSDVRMSGDEECFRQGQEKSDGWHFAFEAKTSKGILCPFE